MNHESLFTLIMYIVMMIMFVIVYLVPLSGILIGVTFLKKRPDKKGLGLTILLTSSLVFLVVILWKVIDLTRYTL